MTTVSDVGDVVPVCWQAGKVVEGALSIVPCWWHVKRWDALAELVCLLHPTLFHAPRERVLVVFVVLGFDLVRENALPLTHRQLSRVVSRVCGSRVDQQLDGISTDVIKSRPIIKARDVVCWVNKYFGLSRNNEIQSPLLVGLKQVAEAFIAEPAG